MAPKNPKIKDGKGRFKIVGPVGHCPLISGFESGLDLGLDLGLYTWACSNPYVRLTLLGLGLPAWELVLGFKNKKQKQNIF